MLCPSSTTFRGACSRMSKISADAQCWTLGVVDVRSREAFSLVSLEKARCSLVGRDNRDFL